MKKVLWILGVLLFLSILGNLFGLFLLDKGLHYRDCLRRIEESFPNEGLHLRSSDEIRAARIENMGVFVGGGLPRYWFFPKDFSFHLANRSQEEEPIATTFERFNENVIRSGAKFVIINAGFCDIFTAIHQGKKISPVLDRVMVNLRKMVDRAREHKILPILTTLTPVRPRFLLPHTRWLPYSAKFKVPENAAYQELNKRMRDYCMAEGVHMIDFFHALVAEDGELNSAYSLPDGEHIHPEGYLHLSRFLEGELKRIFAARTQDP
jgi:lysophospholipase L1-like esterase